MNKTELIQHIANTNEMTVKNAAASACQSPLCECLR